MALIASKYLVTGGSGFIGSHLINYLLSQKEVKKIIILDLDPPKIANPRIEFYKCDIRVPINLNLELENAVCFHLAAVAKEPGFPWDEYFITNYVGTKNLIDFCEKIGIDELIFTSTMMVFRAGESKFNEDSLTAPDTAYGISKILAEKELEIWKCKDINRRLFIIRPGVVYGFGEQANMTRLFNALKRGVFTYVGRKDTIKGLIYVKELVELFNQLLQNKIPTGTYNFVYPEKYRIVDIVNTFKIIFDFKRFVPVLPFRLLIFVSYIFEFLNLIGLKNPIHHRRIEKLYYSTNISSQKIVDAGFQFSFDLETSIADWRKESGGGKELK